MSALYLIIAAILNAFMDRIENENFYESIFRNRSERFWYKRTSWKYAKVIFGWKLDAWHIAKSLMIISLMMAMVKYTVYYNWWVDVIMAGGLWIVTFNIFYNKLFKK